MKFLLLLVLLIFISCSKGGSEPGPVAKKITEETAKVVMAGRASAGNIKNAAVKAYCKNFGEARGDQISNTAITASDGSYTLLFETPPTCPLEIVVADAGDGLAQYVEEATGNTVNLGVREMRTIVPEFPAGTKQMTVAVTLLTELAATYFESKEDNRLAMSVQDMKDLMKASNAFVAAAAGLTDLVGTIPADSTQRTGAETADQKKYAAFLAGISQLAETAGASSFDTLDNFANDLIHDGDLGDTSWGDVGTAYDTFVASADNVTHLGEDGDDTSFLPIENPVLPPGFTFSEVKVAALTLSGDFESQMPPGNNAFTCVEIIVTADVRPTLDTVFSLNDSDGFGSFYNNSTCAGNASSLFTLAAKEITKTVYYKRSYNYGEFDLATISDEIESHGSHTMTHFPAPVTDFTVTWDTTNNSYHWGCNALTIHSVDSTGRWTPLDPGYPTDIVLQNGYFYSDVDCSNRTQEAIIPANETAFQIYYRSPDARIVTDVIFDVIGMDFSVFSMEVLWPTPLDPNNPEIAWHNPLDMNDNISPSGNVDSMGEKQKMVISANGDAMIAWRQGTFGQTRLYLSHRKNGVWTHPASLNDFISTTATGDVYYFNLAMDDNGNALIAWNEYNYIQGAGAIPGYPHIAIYKSEYKNGVWTKPSSIDDAISPYKAGAYYAWAVDVALSNNGDALVVWEQANLNQHHYSIYKSEKRGGVWNHPDDFDDNISPDETPAASPQVAMDYNGNSIITWIQEDDQGQGDGNEGLGQTQIFKSEYRNGAWTHPASLADNISPNASSAAEAYVGMDHQGNAIILWSQYDNGTDTYRLYKSEYRNGGWVHPQSLGDAFTTRSPVSYYDMAIGKGGDILIAYNQNTGVMNQDGEHTDSDYIYYSHYHNGSWKHPADKDDHLPFSEWFFEHPRTAVDKNGNAIITWVAQFQEGDSATFKSEFRNGVWSHPIVAEDNLSYTQGGGAGYSLWPQVVMGDDGTAIISWLGQDNSGVQLFKSEYRIE